MLSKIKNVLHIVKNFLEDFFLDLKNQLFSSKYVLKGKCNRCGACCRNILFSDSKGFVKSKESFENLKKKYRYYRNFKISGRVNDRNDFKNEALTFECKHITKDNKCDIYLFRPYFCRVYPQVNPELIYDGVTMLDGCGYRFEINKSFESYLK